ncbi:hypothetical protein CTAYLR_008472 [Chrysophaeum taylorii]|uniref:Histidine kinase domain-containing protein n=1 Tax=Chrysophaeum taylorii TaxID=2483200 RepID=A0AAD7XK86_9STRA|nr:hypothetical protein CTAYLR_008472 [Chrysophaeum taylorii]
MRVKALTVTVLVSVAVAALALCLAFSFVSTKTTKSAIWLLDKCFKYQQDMKNDLLDIRLTATQYAFGNGSDVRSKIEALVAATDERGSMFESQFQIARRQSASLCECDNQWDRFSEQYDFTVGVIDRALNDYATFFLPRDNAYFAKVFAITSSDEMMSSEDRKLDARFDIFKDCVLRVSRRSRRVVLAIAVITVFVTLACIAALGASRMRVHEEKEAELAAQDKLARQQAHEMKNKFSPAMSCLQAVLDATTLDDYERLKDDVATSLALIFEVQSLHQATLDCYRIFRNQYTVKEEIFDVCTFMDERLKAEKAIAKAHNNNSAVHFEATLPDDYRNCDAVHIETDHYILSHIVTNFLSNSRKNTYEGVIRLEFCGSDGRGRLVFAVRDDGVGVPEAMRPKLFDSGVTTGDTRGSGLGLPSRVQNANGEGGFTGGFSLFEFAVCGRVVTTDPSKEIDGIAQVVVQPATNDPGLPDFLRVVVIDDSGINRRCLINSLDKARALAGATQWTFDEYETIEAAKPVLRMLASDPKVVVTLDENLQSRGGVITGSQAIRWLKSECAFVGVIVSASGDPEVSELHLQLGASVAWGKPAPQPAVAKSDLETCFSRDVHTGFGIRDI